MNVATFFYIFFHLCVCSVCECSSHKITATRSASWLVISIYGRPSAGTIIRNA